MAVGQHVRVSYVEYSPGTLETVSKETDASLMALVRQQAGLIEFAIVQTGHDSRMVIGTWQSREHAEEWATKGMAWLTEVAKISEQVTFHVTYSGNVIMAENAS